MNSKSEIIAIFNKHYRNYFDDPNFRNDFLKHDLQDLNANDYYRSICESPKGVEMREYIPYNQKKRFYDISQHNRIIYNDVDVKRQLFDNDEGSIIYKISFKLLKFLYSLYKKKIVVLDNHKNLLIFLFVLSLDKTETWNEIKITNKHKKLLSTFLFDYLEESPGHRFTLQDIGFVINFFRYNLSNEKQFILFCEKKYYNCQIKNIATLEKDNAYQLVEEIIYKLNFIQNKSDALDMFIAFFKHEKQIQYFKNYSIYQFLISVSYVLNNSFDKNEKLKIIDIKLQLETILKVELDISDIKIKYIHNWIFLYYYNRIVKFKKQITPKAINLIKQTKKTLKKVTFNLKNNDNDICKVKQFNKIFTFSPICVRIRSSNTNNSILYRSSKRLIFD
ncbi:hypothetical protein COBT_002471 [Conglomerata obtusa]